MEGAGSGEAHAWHKSHPLPGSFGLPDSYSGFKDSAFKEDSSPLGPGKVRGLSRPCMRAARRRVLILLVLPLLLRAVWLCAHGEPRARRQPADANRS